MMAGFLVDICDSVGQNGIGWLLMVANLTEFETIALKDTII
jgi:hypothetical protein